MCRLFSLLYTAVQQVERDCLIEGCCLSAWKHPFRISTLNTQRPRTVPYRADASLIVGCKNKLKIF